jgi:N-acetylmuramoyl-L-alanine amidase
MSKIIEHFLVPLFVIVSALYAFNSFSGDGPVMLNKVYHHTTQNPVHLERANMSCYFSGDVQMQEMKHKKQCDTQSCAFFFPKVVINSGECESMIQRLHDYNDSYSITIEELSVPTKGILIVFNFDDKKFALSCEQFDSIGLQKGVVFRLHNKELVKILEQKSNQPVLRTLWNPKCIAIDPGHGGLDCGATGHGGVQEKDICLAISTKVGNLLEQHGFSVVMTRRSDDTVGLDERTSYANNHHADLFVSIHANWASNQRAVGVETFCLKPSLLQRGFSQLSDAQQKFCVDVQQQRAEYSDALAQAVQRHVCDTVSPFHNEPVDRKVKHSVSQVLLGTQAPAILVEVGFVSHPKEVLLLNNFEYQNSVAQGICDGILSVVSYNHLL